MATKKAAKKAVKKAVKKEIVIKLHAGYTLEDLQAAITPALFKRIRAAHKACEPVGVAIAEVIP